MSTKCTDCPQKEECLTGSQTKDIEDPPAVFHYKPLFQSNVHPITVEYIKMPYEKSVKSATFQGNDVLLVDPEILTRLAYDSICDIQHFFRREQLQFWSNILDDVEASSNDRFVALALLKNAVIASQRVLPSCQDTGTAIVFGKKGECVMTGGDDSEALSKGIWKAYQTHNYRYSQMAPINMFKEVNTKNNLPAQIDILSTTGDEYKMMFVAKGGGSANKSFLFQKTKAVLTPKCLVEFISEKMKDFGTSACPPYHIAVVIGGLSAEQTLKTVKLASCRYLDDLPREGDEFGSAFRDVEWEEEVLKISRSCGTGAQFGGKYFAHQVRVIRLPRHGASCPIGLGVSCSADRQILTKITKEGIFMEKLCKDPREFLPPVEIQESILSTGGDVVKIDLDLGMDRLRSTLSEYPIKTRLSLDGTIVVARDISHARVFEALATQNEPLPTFFKDYVIYYAGPAKTPEGYASGSFGPTTAGRMDSYVGPFMEAGGSFVTLAKGNRSKQVTDACRKYKGFYLGSPGGPAALLGKEHIRKVECLAYPELGMEAVWKIVVENFPAFIIVDDKGNDFFAEGGKSAGATTTDQEDSNKKA